jgi:riboflavin kinase/FMN adenylyltransferase
MRVLRSIDGLAEIQGPVVIAAGVFDGMHLGHRAVLRDALRESERIGATPVALSFDPHPATILRPGAVPGLLTPTPFKLRLMERMGFTHALVVNFDKEFAAIQAEDFVEQLCEAAKPLAGICIGQGWAFGNQRRGNIDLLRDFGRKKNFFTCEALPVRIEGLVISSTLIRFAVSEGRLADAAQFLGRDHAMHRIHALSLSHTHTLPLSLTHTHLLLGRDHAMHRIHALARPGRQLLGTEGRHSIG